MTILRLRAELADERGRLGGLASAIAACHGNILGVDVHFVDGARVADEFIIEFPQGYSAAPLTTALRRAGGIALEVEELDEHALVDPVARAIDIAAVLLAGESLAVCIGQLVRADNAEFVSAVEGAAVDVPLTGRSRIAFPEPDPDPDPDGTARRWLVVERVTPPFSSSEVARIGALLRLARAATPAPRRLGPAGAVRRRPASFFQGRSAVTRQA